MQMALTLSEPVILVSLQNAHCNAKKGVNAVGMKAQGAAACSEQGCCIQRGQPLECPVRRQQGLSSRRQSPPGKSPQLEGVQGGLAGGGGPADAAAVRILQTAAVGIGHWDSRHTLVAVAAAAAVIIRVLLQQGCIIPSADSP